MSQTIIYVLLFIIIANLAYVQYYPQQNYTHDTNNHGALVEQLQLKVSELENQIRANEEEINSLRGGIQFIQNAFFSELHEYQEKRQSELNKAKTQGFTESTTTISVSRRYLEVPSFIPYLTSLTTLQLSSNKISELPAHLFQPLSKLENLHLTRNYLKEVPENLLRYLPELKELLLGMNKLTTIPKEIATLTKLESFYIQNNELAEIDSSLFIPLDNLERFDFGYNQISSLPAELFHNKKNLKDLFFGGNQIDSLPPSIYELKNLEALSCAGNKFSEIDWNLFLNLKNLKSIDIRDNRLQLQPVDQLKKYFSTDNFPNLIEVYVQGNRCGEEVCKEGNILSEN